MQMPIYESRAMENVIRMAKMASSSSAPVLIIGESGTGKELIADLIHSSGKRSVEPFIKLNCAAFPRELIESELFGARRGAYTGSVTTRDGLFALAGHGTILLDEITEMPIDIQSKLLRVIQEKRVRMVGGDEFYPINCRIIAATNRHPLQAIAEKKLRHDLYYRLNVISIPIPPLRERKDDIPPLVDFFLEKYSLEENKPGLSVSEKTIEKLCSCRWAGNVRELENAVYRAVVFSNGKTLDFSEFEQVEIIDSAKSMAFENLDGDKILETMEKDVIVRVLKALNGNKQEAAKRLGIGRQTLYNKLKQYNIVELPSEAV